MAPPTGFSTGIRPISWFGSAPDIQMFILICGGLTRRFIGLMEDPCLLLMWLSGIADGCGNGGLGTSPMVSGDRG